MMKLRAVESEEARRHLQETHQRVMSVAAVQQQLHATAPGAPVELEPYLSKLCEALGQSMIGDNRTIVLKVRGDEKTATSRDAESVGLIVTELVINAIKHAFNGTTNDGQIPGVILSMPMLAIAKIICDRLQPLAAFGHFLEG
jgi:two-component sensor histidine kinase